MARGRFVNRKISVSDKLNELPDDTCRLLATWIIPYLDKQGVYYARPAIVKSTIFTLREDITFAQVETYLQAMHDVQLIVLFDGGDGKRYQFWPGFEEEQPNLRPDREKTDMPIPPIMEECEALWRAGNGQATDSQLPVSVQAIDSQVTGYLKPKQVILSEKVSEEKSMPAASVPIPPLVESEEGASQPPPTPPPRFTVEQILKMQASPTPELVAAWPTFLQTYEMANRTVYGQWIKPLVPLCMEDSTVTIGTLTGYAEDWCKNRLINPIRSYLCDVIGHPVNVSFVVMPQPGGT